MQRSTRLRITSSTFIDFLFVLRCTGGPWSEVGILFTSSGLDLVLERDKTTGNGSLLPIYGFGGLGASGLSSVDFSVNVCGGLAGTGGRSIFGFGPGIGFFGMTIELVTFILAGFLLGVIGGGFVVSFKRSFFDNLRIISMFLSPTLFPLLDILSSILGNFETKAELLGLDIEPLADCCNVESQLWINLKAVSSV